MGDIQELIEMADKLCKTLEKVSENEKRFCYEMQYLLEVYSWDVFRMKNHIQEAVEFYGM